MWTNLASGNSSRSKPDARGVGRGLEHERALVFESEFFQKPEERGFPCVDLGVRHAMEVEVTRIFVFAARES